MSAIITDQLRINNAKSFVEKVFSGDISYYTFIGLSNPEEIKADWDQFPPSPKDSFNEENNYWDTIISLKRIASGDVRQLVRKIEWNSGDIFDMYRHDVTRDITPTDKRSKPSNSTTLYQSNYYVVNSDFRVYICLYNGASPENNFQGVPSLDEPTFTDFDPRAAGTSGDGYLWKYLYTIKPSEIIKFDSIDYIPVPKNWGNEGESISVKNHAINSDQIKVCTIRNRGRGLGTPRVITNVPIVGDGVGIVALNATASIVIGNDSRVESIQVTNGGRDYTFASVDWKSVGISATEEEPEFDVIIPPQGGHGFDIYRELGAYYVLLYSRFENDTNNPDFIVGNKVSRIGLIENPKQFGSQQVLETDTASGVFALKLKGISPNDDEFKTTSFSPNSIITQTVESGVIAVGKVVSYDQETGILKYWQDKSIVGFNYDGTVSTNPEYGLKLNRFSDFVTGLGNIKIQGGTKELEIDINFGTNQNPESSINNINLGQSFVGGISNPEVQKYTGNIIYVDNRPSILRSLNQKEDIKIVLQF
jgi:hypothetical protein